ncbi:MAG: methionine ABC transporter ATP-binding protein [Clostridium argentinense]|uniref:Methionine ABC transporter ATP-binding protein n=1 Tax=Clostridium faecium TaxID=2762223 RepID=A0ABR8YVA7_9CLOT|nr:MULTISPECIES: methionine ABC transporter ATP-binding protein [Clostridium]MBD8048170.1 methionine ABC transporter ATP-binding protein [Clostridium faecium]MBS5823620.1 methionine ABC transporter ATP-binding protein [Clostridium argentinense]MDU1348651.1 methionine ABC transporter ATP-binding protein [Clostridium argentinense]
MIEVSSLEKNFGNLKVLKNINLKINKGEIFGIVGHSGVGKSTLLRCLNKLEGYDKGTIKIEDKEINNLEGKELREFRKNLGMIFQNFSLLERKTVFENIALPMECWGFDKKYIKSKVLDLLKVVNLEDKINSKPKELSGGQKQRVAIARALALDPHVLLCDEATSALDPKTTKDILKLLREINERLNITIIIVTHQMEVIREICNRVAIMESGEIVEMGDVEELFLKPPKALKRLIGEEDIIPDTGVNIKIFFPKDASNESIITSMARELDIDISIVWGKLERFRDDVLGSLVINVNNSNEKKVIEYLSNKDISWEVVNNE